MAALKLLLSQARRHYLTKHSSHFHSPISLTSHRSFSSSSESDPPPRPFEPLPIQPVSYPAKPKDTSPPPHDAQPSDTRSLRQPPPPREVPEPQQALTREDIRYVKDAPSVTPVSYPLRVAPLPEDKVPEVKLGNEEMETERRRIEAEDQLRKRMARAVEDERMKVPFPLLIRPKQKEKPPVLDLAEAIRQVKVRGF